MSTLISLLRRHYVGQVGLFFAFLLAMTICFRSSLASAALDCRVKLINSQSKIRFSEEHWEQIEIVLRDQDYKLSVDFREKIRKVLKSGRPDMGSALAKVFGVTALLHKTASWTVTPILKAGAILPSNKIKGLNKLLEENPVGREVGTFMYDKAFFMPVGKRHERTKIPYYYTAMMVFDVSLLDDLNVETNNAWMNGPDGGTLRKDPGTFLRTMVEAYLGGRAEVMTSRGLSLEYLQAIVVPRKEELEQIMEDLETAKIKKINGRPVSDYLVVSRYALGG